MTAKQLARLLSKVKLETEAILFPRRAMNLRVKAAALSLVAVATFTGGAAAFADDDENESHPLPGLTAPIDGKYPKPHHPHAEEQELHDRYGNDIGAVNLPPLVVKEETKTSGSSLGGAKPVTGTSSQQKSTANSEKLVNADNTNPAANLPVDPTNINPNEGTPADTFFNAATFGLGAMGLGALALGGVALTRSIKLRKDPKADFLYQ
jgi:hypothetical protein